MSERAFIQVGGEDRISFLQGILTQDVAKLEAEKIQFAALLSPQGKLLHDMFLVALPDAVLIDTDAATAPTLLKRLTMYKLRAKVTLAEVSADWQLTLQETGSPDPRHALLPRRQYRQGAPAAPFDAAALWTARLKFGIPEMGSDIQPDSITAMDAGYDLLNAISFTKGCYVGQEVTARMHYKSIARKGFFTVASLEPLADGTPILAGERAIGTVTSAQGRHALAFLKFDDARSALSTANGHPVSLAAPEWMQPKLALFENGAKNQ